MVEVHCESPNLRAVRTALLSNDRTSSAEIISVGGGERRIALRVQAAHAGQATVEATNLLRAVLGDFVSGELWVEAVREIR